MRIDTDILEVELSSTIKIVNSLIENYFDADAMVSFEKMKYVEEKLANVEKLFNELETNLSKKE